MRLMLWAVSFLLLGLWSLLAWAAAGLIGFVELWVPGIAGDPLGLGLAAANWADWLGLAGTAAIVLIWAVGALTLLLGTFALGRALGAAGKLARGRRQPMRALPPFRDRQALTDRWASRLAPHLTRYARR
jgi:hypothetical protein